MIRNSPLCRDDLDAPGHPGAVALCDYYTATFERLFRALVDPRATARRNHVRG